MWLHNPQAFRPDTKMPVFWRFGIVRKVLRARTCATRTEKNRSRLFRLICSRRVLIQNFPHSRRVTPGMAELFKDSWLSGLPFAW